jgi:hypothetical protein
MAARVTTLNNTELLVLATVRQPETSVTVGASGRIDAHFIFRHQRELTKLLDEGFLIRHSVVSFSVTEKGEAALQGHRVRLERLLERLKRRSDGKRGA